MTRRTERLNHQIQVELSDLLRKHINDPRLGGLISITRVDISRDLRDAKIYISAIGGQASHEDVLKGFNSASGFLRRELAHRLNTRIIPVLGFYFDDSIEKGVNLVTLIEQVTASDSKAEADGRKRHTKRK
jgi:ribosome-binding factor A